jgi:hypothetical protein
MRRALPVVLACLAVLVACSSEPVDGPAATVSAEPVVVTTSPTTSAARPADAEVGQVVTSRGITLTVTEARAIDSVQMNESSFRAGSGYEKYTTKLPDGGGRFVMVKAHVVNNAQVSLDLTCSLPISTKIIDAQQRNFDAIDDLYKIKGNPECNKQLQPGFEADMTWVYLVPKSATVIGWGFSDYTDFSALGDYSTVRFDA